jgi:hypothetical protein
MDPVEPEWVTMSGYRDCMSCGQCKKYNFQQLGGVSLAFSGLAACLVAL